mmetsp:Transcript_32882/g.105466  ORF Transcript_32882/g.105466 Transcript_32882/m.105466 type:complete len:205 (-) Transcript_32882:143-757(-)
MAAVCDICGKVLRSASAEAMAAHKRESQSCTRVKTKGASGEVARLEEKLRAVIEAGRRLAAHGGAYDVVEANTKERGEVEAALKEARSTTKAEKARVKELAQQSMSAAGWTSALLQGEENRFAKADEGAVESQLAAATVGLVSSAAFREKREELEAAAGAKREREAEEAAEAAAAQQARKRAKKREREKAQQRGLSFAADEEDG